MSGGEFVLINFNDSDEQPKRTGYEELSTGVLAENRDLKSENQLHSYEIADLKSKNDLLDRVLNDIAIRLGFQQFEDDLLIVRIDQLAQDVKDFSEGILERDRQISNYKLEIEDRDRKIVTLEDNLDRARSEHLQQLRAIVQILQPLADQKVGWANDWTVGALKLAIAVVKNNIEKLHSSPTDDL